MILEVADIRIVPGQQSAFEDAIRRGLGSVVVHAKGFRGWKLNHGIETPERYLLMIFGTRWRITPSGSVRGRCLRNGAASSGRTSRHRRQWNILSCRETPAKARSLTRGS